MKNVNKREIEKQLCPEVEFLSDELEKAYLKNWIEKQRKALKPLLRKSLLYYMSQKYS